MCQKRSYEKTAYKSRIFAVNRSDRKRRTWIQWFKMYQALVQYTRLHGDPHVPNTYHDGTLARWVTSQRSRRWGWLRRFRPLSTKQIKLLDELGFCWVGIRVTTHHTRLKADQRWMKRYQALVRYAGRHGGDIRVPPSYRDRSLVIWIRVQRKRRWGSDDRAGRPLSTKQIQLLDRLGFCWDPHEDSWDRKFEELRKFIARHGHANVPCVRNGRSSPLAAWVRRQRLLKRKGLLSQSRRRKWATLSPHCSRSDR